MSALVAIKGKDLADGVVARLDAPFVGRFLPAVSRGDAVQAGRLLGHLLVLGRKRAVLAPDVAGQVTSVAGDGPVEYGAPLVSLGAASAAEGEAASAADGGTTADGYPVRTPIDGIFYLRPSPDAPAYVSVGDRVTSGATLGLVEVMKTFNPLTLGGPGAPESGVVTAVLASDGDEVASGEVLFRVKAD